MIEFFSALALAIIIEGVVYAAFPEQMKRMLASIMSMPASRIRAVGLACAAIGLALLWWLRG